MSKVKAQTIRRLVKLENQGVLNILVALLKTGLLQDESKDPITRTQYLYEFVGRGEAMETAMEIAHAAGVKVPYPEWHRIDLRKLQDLPPDQPDHFYKTMIFAILPSRNPLG